MPPESEPISQVEQENLQAEQERERNEIQEDTTSMEEKLIAIQEMGTEGEEHPDTMQLDLAIVDLKRALVDAMDMMGPGELATRITGVIEDPEYLQNVIRQMQNNLDGRTQEIPF